MADIRRARDRFHTVGEGIETWHSFSYGRHYDADRVGVGPLIAINEEHLAPGTGYPRHRHSDVDILTWVVEGKLTHEDSTGTSGDIEPGVIQYLAAGSGVEHTESNSSDTESLTFLQMMVRSHHDAAPEYASVEIPESLGLHAGPVLYADARVFVARLDAHQTVTLPPGAAYLVHVVRGTVTVAGAELKPGDEIELGAGAPPQLATATRGEAVAWVVDSANTR